MNPVMWLSSLSMVGIQFLVGFGWRAHGGTDELSTAVLSQ